MLVWKAPTRIMNPTIPETLVRSAFEGDAVAAKSEYGDEDIEFRGDVRAYLDEVTLQRAIMPERRSIPPRNDVVYTAFVDMSGGRHDAATLGIAHRESASVVLDRIEIALAPFDPDEVTTCFAATLSGYGLNQVMGDRYGGEYPVSAFRKHGIDYETAPFDRSALYREILPLFSSAQVELLDNRQLVSEMRTLERRARQGGRGDQIDHKPGAHDDAANAACGALLRASLLITSTTGRHQPQGFAKRDYDPFADDRDTRPVENVTRRSRTGL